MSGKVGELNDISLRQRIFGLLVFAVIFIGFIYIQEFTKNTNSRILNPSPGLLDKALIPGESKQSDFDKWKDAGGFPYDETWRKHWITGVSLVWDKDTDVLKKMELDLQVEGLGTKGHRLASFDNLKEDLKKECGDSWEILGSASNNSKIAKSPEYTCDLTINGGKAHVLVMKN